MNEQMIKGSVLRSRLEFVREQGGDDAMAKVVESLSPEDQSSADTASAGRNTG